MDDTKLLGGIVRIEVPRLPETPSRGTGFIVRIRRAESGSDLVELLTALHVLADLEASHLRGETVWLGTDVNLRCQSSTIVVRLDDTTVLQHSVGADWALLRCEVTPPHKLVALRLAALEARLWPRLWRTFGFTAAQPNTGEPLNGKVKFEAPELIHLHCEEAAAGSGGRVSGCSGAPCVFEGYVIGIINEALQKKGKSIHGAVYALPIPGVAEACKLPLAPGPQEGEGEVEAALAPMRSTTLQKLAKALDIPFTESEDGLRIRIARALFLADEETIAKLDLDNSVETSLAPILPAFSSHRAVVSPPAPFSLGWFERRFASVKQNLDRRYRPELHFDADIQLALQGLVCAVELEPRVRATVSNIDASWRAVPHEPIPGGPALPWSDAAQSIQAVTTSALEVALDGLTPLDLEPLHAALAAADEILRRIRDAILVRLKAAREQDAYLSAAQALWRTSSRLRDCIIAVDVLYGLVHDSLRFAAARFMILGGDAGSGKSHVLAHVCEQRISGGAPTIMLLGDQFQRGDPWAQILVNLDLKALRTDEFLHSLEHAARVSGRRALIAIDALNESDAQTHAMWQAQLNGMLALVRSHPKLALIVSVRSSFMPAVLPENLLVSEHVVLHHGFVGRESEAVAAFLQRFGLPPRQTPLLTPEHANPLFLILYCGVVQSLRRAGDPRELSGFTELFDTWIKQAGDRAAARHGWDRQEKLIQRGLERLAVEVTHTTAPLIPRDRAKSLLLEVLPERDFQRSLFKALLAENLIIEVVLPDESYVRFQYERVRDILVARALIREHLAKPRKRINDFGRSAAMRRLWADPLSNAGTLDALAILLPEEHRIALHTILPASLRAAAMSISLRNLAWLPATAVTIALVRDALAEPQSRRQVVVGLLSLAGRPRHPLNGRFLHACLAPMSLPDRDAMWSLPLATDSEFISAFGRLLEWVEVRPTFSDITDDEHILPLSLALGWALTTSNRSIRDRATKALIRLFEDHLAALVRWLEILQEANDPYVVERVLAVAYGAVLRAPVVAGLAAVASAIFRRWFDPGPPPVHILARDYARGVVEFAAHQRVLDSSLDLTLARPPYASSWQDDLPATETLLEQLGGNETLLVRSLIGFGDFDRYVVGSNSWHFPWKHLRLDQPEPISASATIEIFVAALDGPALAAWTEFLQARDELATITQLERLEPLRGRFAKLPDMPELPHIEDLPGRRDEASRRVDGALTALAAVLTEPQRIHLHTQILERLHDPEWDKHEFPLALVRQHLLYAVLELGWSEARFAEADRVIQRSSEYGRSRTPAERLGKKYQWIALHRVLAQISDRFRYNPRHHADGGSYRGPWQLGRRDLDPTCLLTRTAAEPFRHPLCWWSPVPVDIWGDEFARLLPTRQLPDPTQLLRVVDDAGVAWLILESSRLWDEQHDDASSALGLSERRLRYFLRAYIIHIDARDAVMAWARTRKFFNERSLEEIGELTPELMLRERGWAPAWTDFNVPYYSHPSWTAPEGLEHEILPAWDLYMVEGDEKDATIADGYTLHLPADELRELLQLRHDRRDGYFVDAGERVAAFDPSIAQAGPRAALLREDLLPTLRAAGYDLVWILHGDEFLTEQHLRSEGASRGLSGAFMWDEQTMTGYLQCYTDGERGRGMQPALETLEFPVGPPEPDAL